MKPKTQPFVFQPLLIDLPTARAHCPQTFLAVIQWWFCPVYQSGAALMVSLGGEFHWTHVEVSNANVLIASATGPTGCWSRNKDQEQKCPSTCEGRHIASLLQVVLEYGRPLVNTCGRSELRSLSVEAGLPSYCSLAARARQHMSHNTRSWEWKVPETSRERSS